MYVCVGMALILVGSLNACYAVLTRQKGRATEERYSLILDSIIAVFEAESVSELQGCCF
jgi:hypothetical protein